MIVDHEVVHLPSASVLPLLRRGNPGRAQADRGLAIFADPVLAARDPRLGRTAAVAAEQTVVDDDLLRAAGDAGVTSLERLPFSRVEADTIATIAGPTATLKAVDFDASRERALAADISRYRMLHFATHGLVNTRLPRLSGIVLSLVGRDGAARDGFVRLHDVYNMRLGADLVTLSACQTALGKDVRGEGLIGLTRGFMYAGVPRVVASVWSVRDRATAELMRRFYDGMLRRGLRPAAALRAAQLEQRRDPRWAAPHYWAGFVLQGEWR
jgi:CHAT domain-containing protein